jgi:enoyl-[acyl-carrier-protein] reductase (NADH)
VHQIHRHPDEAPSITVDDIARSILYLASDSSAGVNGVILPVDNGWSTV